MDRHRNHRVLKRQGPGIGSRGGLGPGRLGPLERITALCAASDTEEETQS